NVGTETAQLFWRHWLIHDLVAGDHEVEGEGVVGQSPVLRPGDSHRYNSFCILRGPTGHMEGFYHFRRRDGSVFRAPIPRFQFTAPPEAVGTLFN
ncbi:MAG: ApaG domain, partial [Gemmatimonadales bacterium]|nr:ApaG domain [Gemmatimonadales bacterium]